MRACKYQMNTCVYALCTQLKYNLKNDILYFYLFNILPYFMAIYFQMSSNVKKIKWELIEINMPSITKVCYLMTSMCLNNLQPKTKEELLCSLDSRVF